MRPALQLAHLLGILELEGRAAPPQNWAEGKFPADDASWDAENVGDKPLCSNPQSRSRSQWIKRSGLWRGMDLSVEPCSLREVKREAEEDSEENDW